MPKSASYLPPKQLPHQLDSSPNPALSTRKKSLHPQSIFIHSLSVAGYGLTTKQIRKNKTAKRRLSKSVFYQWAEEGLEISDIVQPESLRQHINFEVVFCEFFTRAVTTGELLSIEKVSSLLIFCFLNSFPTLLLFSLAVVE
jgi:hypothetical protein